MHKEMLERIEQEIKSSKEITGAFYTGSTATGRFDGFSDLDIDLVTQEDPERVRKRLLEFISKNWEIKLIYHSEKDLIVFITNDFFKIEFDILSKEDLSPDYRMKLMKIVKDENDFLQNIKKKSQKYRIEADYDNTIKLLLKFRDSQLYTARHTARGWRWSAMGEANYRGEQLFYLLAKLKGRYQFGFREAEKFLNKEELEMLRDTRCHSADLKEIQRAMKANWRFMKYIEKQYEMKSGKKLNLESPDKELLECVDRIYSRAR